MGVLQWLASGETKFVVVVALVEVVEVVALIADVLGIGWVSLK